MLMRILAFTVILSVFFAALPAWTAKALAEPESAFESDPSLQTARTLSDAYDAEKQYEAGKAYFLKKLKAGGPSLKPSAAYGLARLEMAQNNWKASLAAYEKPGKVLKNPKILNR